VTERDVHLLLSQRAARTLVKFVCRHIDHDDEIEEDGRDDRILAAIIQDLDDQVEKKPKKKKGTR